MFSGAQAPHQRDLQTSTRPPWQSSSQPRGSSDQGVQTAFSQHTGRHRTRLPVVGLGPPPTASSHHAQPLTSVARNSDDIGPCPPMRTPRLQRHAPAPHRRVCRNPRQDGRPQELGLPFATRLVSLHVGGPLSHACFPHEELEKHTLIRHSSPPERPHRQPDRHSRRCNRPRHRQARRRSGPSNEATEDRIRHARPPVDG